MMLYSMSCVSEMPLWVPGLEKVIYSRYNKYRQRNEGVSSVEDGTPLFI